MEAEQAVHCVRHGVCDRAFRRKLLLATDVERAADWVRRGGELRVRLAACQMQRRQHVLLAGFRFGGGED
ncbi:hypothetical protein, partial [Paraburkholderia ginsengiterrae]|uniref:hypothetical protein n=1 Tax=Paraburkholderia ginsengiterrae TaxID=1462993 RepID=UPI003133A771